MSKIINGVESEYDMPMKYENKKQTIVIDNDYDNSIKREDKPFIWISEEIFTLKRDKDKLQQENKQLKEKINTYEDPEDLTLMFMYCDEKAKDKIKQLKEVIEEVREYIKDACYYYDLENYSSMTSSEVKELLQILDKVKENK